MSNQDNEHHFHAKRWLEGQLGHTVEIHELRQYFGISEYDWYSRSAKKGGPLRLDPNWLNPNMCFHVAERLGLDPVAVMMELGVLSDPPMMPRRSIATRAGNNTVKNRRAAAPRTDIPL